jgi:hypothetical protein
MNSEPIDLNAEVLRHFTGRTVGTDKDRPGIALFRRAGGPGFVAAESAGSGGQLGIGQHFAQGVIIAK